MGEKYFGTKNDKANMPQEVVQKTYAKKQSAFTQDYGDTQEHLDSEFNKAISKVKQIKKK